MATAAAMTAAMMFTAAAQTPSLPHGEMTRLGNLLRVTFSVSTPDGLESNHHLTVTPVVTTGTDSIVLKPIVLAGRASYYTMARRGDTGITKATRGGSLRYQDEAAWQQWMERAALLLRVSEEGCCGKPSRSWTEVIAPADIKAAMPDVSLAYITPDPPVNAAELTEKTRSIDGSAYIDYRVNRTEIDPMFSNNLRELARIDSTIAPLKADPDITISSLHIRGYASPEGSYANNERLAKGRTASVVEYVGTLYDFAPGTIGSSYDPEDWGGLIKRLSDLNIANRDAILAVARDSSLQPDARDARMKSLYPEQYDYILRTIYPRLRHTDYTINYTITSYTDPAVIVEVGRHSPDKLSWKEICYASQSLEPGSRPYADLWTAAVRLDPTSAMAVSNAATAWMDCKEFDRAAAILDAARCDSAVTDRLRRTLIALQTPAEPTMTREIPVITVNRK